jgi:MFS family permease
VAVTNDRPAATGAADGPFGMPRDIWVLAVISFFVSIGFGIIGPAIPLLAKQFGVGAAMAGLAISAFAAFRLLSALGSGALVGRLGERTVLASGLVVQATTSILAGLAPTFELLVLFRAIGGLGSAAFSIASMMLLLRLAPEHKRGRAMGVYQGGGIMGSIAGPAIGGVLADITPRLPLLVYGAFLLLAAAVGLAQLTPIATRRGAPVEEALQAEDVEDNIAVTEPITAEPVTAETAGSRIPLGPAYLACLLANFAAGWVFYGMRNSLLPLFIVEDLGRTAAWTGMAFFLAAIVQGLALLRAGWVADIFGRRTALVAGLAIGLGSLAIFCLPISAVLFLVPMATFGIAAAFMATAPAALLGDIAHGRGGRTIAVFSMMSDFGAIVGPLASGRMADAASYPAAFSLSAGVILLALIPALMLRSPKVPVPGPGGAT